MPKRQVMRHAEGQHELWLWPSIRSVGKGEWLWPHFSPEEMACRGSGVLLIAPLFMDVLERVRKDVGEPMMVTSGYRSSDHNAAVSGKGRRTGPHTDSQAVDVQVTYGTAYEVIAAASKRRFQGIGLRQHGEVRERFVHLDCWYKRTRRTVWTYNEAGL